MFRAIATIVIFIFSQNLLSHPVGELFLVDHYQTNSKETPAHNLYKKWITEKNLGGMVFWNGDKVNAKVFKTMLTDYQQVAIQNGLFPPILTIDHEGKGVQRLRSRHGFSDLVSPHRLGQAVEQTGDTKLCYLHGAILSQELRHAGFNSALSTISDVFRVNRGTKNLLIERAISANPHIVASCVQAILEGASAQASFLFYTKHFPGLGSVNGNTDTRVRKSTARNMKEATENVFPYRQVIEFNNNRSRGAEVMALGIMASNSYYPLYDQDFPAIESQVILEDLLRNKLGFKGLVSSDALWVGKYEKLSQEEFNIAISQMILSGTDQLMIASSRFIKSYNFFKDFYQGTVPKGVSDALLVANQIRDKNELIAWFKERVDESAWRVNEAKSYLQAGVKIQSSNSEKVPREVSANLRKQYEQIVQSLDIKQPSL